MNLIQSLQEKIIAAYLEEAKDSVSDQIKEWNALQKKMAVITSMSKAISSRITELETSFDTIVGKLKSQKKEVDGVILEYTQVKGRRTVGYKDGVAKALELLIGAKRDEFQTFMESVTRDAQTSTVLSIESPELGEFIEELKGMSGADLLARAEELAVEFDKLPKQVKKLKEGVAINLVKVISNIVKNFATKFKKFFSASEKVDKAIENLKAAVKADPLMEFKEPSKEDDKTEKKHKVSGHIEFDLKKGAFHKWLGIPEDQDLTMKDIDKGLRSEDKHVRKMALFAKNELKFKNKKEDKEKDVKESLTEGKVVTIENLKKINRFLVTKFGETRDSKDLENLDDSVVIVPELNTKVTFKNKTFRSSKFAVTDIHLSFDRYGFKFYCFITSPFIEMQDLDFGKIEIESNSIPTVESFEREFTKQVKKMIKAQEEDIDNDQKSLSMLRSFVN